jgi:hypothetical protein
MSPSQLPQHQLRLFFISHPRTGSNLFCKIFSKHPQISQLLYPDFATPHMYGPERQTQIKNAKMDEIRELNSASRGVSLPSYQYTLDCMQNHIAKSEAEVTLLV